MIEDDYYTDVLVSFNIITKYFKSYNNLFIDKPEYIEKSLSQENNLINYIKSEVQKFIKANKFIVQDIVIEPEDNRIPFWKSCLLKYT